MGATSGIEMPLINLTNPLECMTVGAQGCNIEPRLLEAGKKYLGLTPSDSRYKVIRIRRAL
jgi:hypothetical protein